MRKMLLPLIGAVIAAAQTPAFEVASIKPNRSGEGRSSIRGSAGRITMENVPLRKVTLWAYGTPDEREYALVGPDWLATERFDIQATFPADASAQQVRQMTQNLLAERFKLALHRESRERLTFVLVVGKNGPKIHAVEDGPARTSGGPGRLEATKVSMPKLADLLAKIMGQTVVDATELKGAYDFTLEWSPDEKQSAPQADDATAGSSGPSIFSALQEQLGLKLEGRKGPAEILVVDHVEKAPTRN